jgi:hypothetical protein
MFWVPDYRSLVAQIRTECPNCQIVAGSGWGGAVPACLLYESHGMPIGVAQSNDTVGTLDQRFGNGHVVYFFPTGEPMMAALENDFIASYVSERHESYSRVDTSQPVSAPPAAGRAPAQQDANGHPGGE